MTGRKATSTLSALALLAAGCASSGVEEGFEPVARVTAERLGEEATWRRGAEEDDAVRVEVGALLAEPLTMDRAVRLALVHSPRLQAEFERLGVAHADWIEAGLIENPVVGATWQGVSGGEGERWEVGLVQSLMSLPVRPAQKRLAALELERTRLEVSQDVLATALAVREAYVDLAAAESAAAAVERVARAVRAGAEFARRQREAGTINALEFAERRALAAEVEADLARAEQEAVAARERLGLLLGVEAGDWSIEPGLTAPQAVAGGVETLTARALEQRLDLAAGRLEIEQLAEALDVTLRWRWFLVADVGVEYEEEVDGVDLFGPTLSIQLPIFDRGQARLARLKSLERASRRRLTQAALEVRSGVREAYARLESQRKLTEQYREVLLPARREVVAEAQKHYNYMLLGTYRLLEARRDVIEAEVEYVEALSDAWRAWIDLERAVGGPLAVAAGVVEAREPEVEEQEMEKEMEHEHE